MYQEEEYMKKRLWAALLTVVMALSLLALPAGAATAATPTFY